MRPAICRERWERIERILARLGGKTTIRNLERSYGIRAWEVEQSAELGWLTITTHKPRVGRPARIVEFRDYQTAKLPRWRCMIEKEFSYKHQAFAEECNWCIAYGRRHWGVAPFVEAYLRVYSPQSRRGAYASTSRLLRHPAVRALRQWHAAQFANEISSLEETAKTVSGIWKRLREVGSWRARLAP